MPENHAETNVWLSPDELSQEEQRQFAELNKGGRLVSALKQARQDFDSGNFATFASIDEYVSEIEKQVSAKTPGHSLAASRCNS